VKSADGWRRYSTADGLPSNDVNPLVEDSTRNMWIGTAAGLAVMHDGRMQAPNLPALRGSILGLAEDGAGAMWVAAADRVLIAPIFRSKLPESERLSVAELVRDLNAAGLLDAVGIKRHRVLTTTPAAVCGWRPTGDSRWPTRTGRRRRYPCPGRCRRGGGRWQSRRPDRDNHPAATGASRWRSPR
jgi:hypothetical protein